MNRTCLQDGCGFKPALLPTNTPHVGHTTSMPSSSCTIFESLDCGIHFPLSDCRPEYFWGLKGWQPFCTHCLRHFSNCHLQGLRYTATLLRPTCWKRAQCWTCRSVRLGWRGI